MSEPTSFVPSGYLPPTGLDHPEFRLRPLGPEHNDSDYAAWTSSVEHIHGTPGFSASGWPRPMTVDENRGDLERHAADFAGRTGFTYTMLAAASDEVIGCVYIYPAADGEGAVVKSWVSASHAELDEPLYRLVSAWLARDWPFTKVSFDPR